jgi:acyl-CoA dehydrogenase
MSDLDDLLDQILGRASEHAGEGTDDGIWPILAEAGLTRVGIAEDLGGSGGSRRDAAAIVTRAAEAGLTTPLAETLFPVAYLAKAAGPPVPPGIVAVTILGEGCWTAVPGGYRIQASGAVAEWGAQADELWVVAPAGQAQGGDKHAGLARLHPGSWTGRPGRNLAGEPRDTVDIDAVVTGESGWLLPAGVLETTQLMAALGRSCQLLGALRACLRLSREYALVRYQFGQSLATHQVVRHAIAGLIEDTAAAETAVSHAVGLLPGAGVTDAGSGAGAAVGPGTLLGPASALAIASAKTCLSRSATRAARAAHQLHGAVGLTAEHPLHFYTTRLWAWRDECGPEGYWSERIAAIVRDTYDGDLWAALTAQGQESASHT